MRIYNRDVYVDKNFDVRVIGGDPSIGGEIVVPNSDEPIQIDMLVLLNDGSNNIFNALDYFSTDPDYAGIQTIEIFATISDAVAGTPIDDGSGIDKL